MATKTKFPHTENVAADDFGKQAFGTATSQSLGKYPPSYAIFSRKLGSDLGKVSRQTSFYRRMEVERRGVSTQLVGVTKKPAFREDYTQVSMSRVKPIDVERKVAIPASPTIFESSPLYPFQSLKTGWDGYWAEPLSQEVLLRANQLWRRIEQITVNQTDLPVVRPAANGSVALTWNNEYPKKELEIWLYDQPDYYAEWMLSIDDQDEEDTAQSQAELLKVIRQYQES